MLSMVFSARGNDVDHDNMGAAGFIKYGAKSSVKSIHTLKLIKLILKTMLQLQDIKTINVQTRE